MRGVEPVAIGYTYRTLLPLDGHLLRLRVDQPTHGLHVTLDYGDTDIAYINVLDYIASGERTRIARSDPELPERTVELSFDDWVFPRSGVAFVWIHNIPPPLVSNNASQHRKRAVHGTRL